MELKNAFKSRLLELYLPRRNPFIPRNLKVKKKQVKEPAAKPKLIRNNNGVRIWYKTDFRVPEANLFVHFRTTLPSNTAGDFLKAKLYTKMVCDVLDEYAYDAELANLTYAVSSHLTGIQIIISGYDEMFPVLLEKVLVTIRDLEVEPCRFEVVKERLSEELGNFVFMKPYEQIIWFTRWLDGGVSYVSE
jgi:insulysin